MTFLSCMFLVILFTFCIEFVQIKMSYPLNTSSRMQHCMVAGELLKVIVSHIAYTVQYESQFCKTVELR